MLSSGITLTCISKKRPFCVPEMEKLCPGVLWLVASKEDKKAYELEGAKRVQVVRGGLVAARNEALHIALETETLNLSVDDNTQGFYRCFGRTWNDVLEVPLEDIAQEMLGVMLSSGLYLVGTLPAHNPFYARPRIHTWAHCSASLIMIDPCQEIWWQKGTDWKDDWVMTARHLQAYGAIARLDYVYSKRTLGGSGGLRDDRTHAIEIREAKKVLARFPDIIRKDVKGLAARPGKLFLKHNIRNCPSERAKELYKELNHA